MINSISIEFGLALLLMATIILGGGILLFTILTESEERIYTFESEEEYEDTGENMVVVVGLEAERGFRNGGQAYINPSETGVIIEGVENSTEVLSKNDHFPTLIQLNSEAGHSEEFINLFNQESIEEKSIELEDSVSIGMDISTIENGEATPTNKYSFKTKDVEVREGWKRLFLLGLIAIISLAFTAVSGLESLINLK